MSTAEETTSATNSATPAAQPSPDLLERTRQTLRELTRLVAERAESERLVEHTKIAASGAADYELQRARNELTERSRAAEDSLRQTDEIRRRSIIDRALEGEADAKSNFARESRRIAADFDANKSRAAGNHTREKNNATAAFESAEKNALSQYTKTKRPFDDASKLIDAYHTRLDTLFDAYAKLGYSDTLPKPLRETYNFDNPLDELSDRLTKIEKPLRFVEGLAIPKIVTGGKVTILFIAAFLIVIGPCLALLDTLTAIIAAFVGAIVVGFGLRIWLKGVALKQLRAYGIPVTQAFVDAHALAVHCYAQLDEKLKNDRARLTQIRDEAHLLARTNHGRAIQAAEQARDDQLRQINNVYANRVTEIQTEQQVALREAIETNERKKAELAERTAAARQKVDEKYTSATATVKARHEESWKTMATRWRDGMSRVNTDLNAIRQEVDATSIAWTDLGASEQASPKAVPQALRVGEIRVNVADLPGGVSADSRLREGVESIYIFPIVRSMGDRPNLVVEFDASGRTTAIAAVQAAMLRLLTSLPAGAIRFTLVDPIGAGRNFGAFMHLADFDETLIGGQVWTEPRQIEEKLGELAGHMERVNQKYLRNEYATIQEYNAAAGEVAEPYRVAVVADYPQGFDEKSAGRLCAMAARGTPCGVLTLVALDRDRPLPHDASHEELCANALVLSWNGNQLTWNDPDFGKFPLLLDSMPAAELSTRLVQRSAKEARDAKRVEVPFEFIAPSRDAWWTFDSRAGIDLPLGKAGANKRQNLSLGKGTSQHVLVAGRTGSGKSTLLHALITNIAVSYSPDQVELYLIDFKKGVEFKVYVTQNLPHASVIAIESEREFGISVLQRLDNELKMRADRFRDVGVQDLNGYRALANQPPLPRILLVVDEFQEFFVEEDKLAQEAALLLDRLVRQGRAFGVHVILGSQTLGGAFTLARTTVGQMGVRIALQCSEADSHLILSEQNTAARLLSRPGEAVYNDANGMTEGNHFFQVVWLGDDRRESYLKQIHAFAQEHPPVITRTPIVFEGDAPANLSRNTQVEALVNAASWESTPRSARAWVGEPIAIKEPTFALFRRQGGNHLLIVGQNDEAALGVISATIVSLALQFPVATSDEARQGAKFFILDGTPEDHPHTDALAKLAAHLPHRAEVGNWRDTTRILSSLAAEVTRRGQPDAPDGPEVFLFIYDLPRFRDLRKPEDEFSFSRREEETPFDLLRSILREGPSVGVHVIAWCDNLNNLNRSFDHQGLREFEMRVLFQMSQNDSGHLLESPAASKLGPHRALFASEEQNRLEKFRPYKYPDAAWLEKLKERLAARS